MKSNLSIFSFLLPFVIFGVIREIISKSSVMDIFPCVLFEEFYSFSSYIWVFDPFWVNLYIWYEVGVQLYSSACGYPVFLAPLVEKIVLSPLNVLDTLLKNHLIIYERVSFWSLYSIPLVCMSILMSL